MAYSKVILNGTTLMDVTQKTVAADKLLSGYTALKNDGTGITGTYTPPSGTAGTPVATKGAVSNHAVSVTPSVTNTTGYITGGTKTGTAVSVSASELVSGTLSITNNGTADVTNYASVDVNVSGGGGGGSYTVTIELDQPVSASSFGYCKIYEWDGSYQPGQQIGEITSATGSATVTTSTGGITLRMSGDYVVPPTHVGGDVWSSEMIALAGTSEGGIAVMNFVVASDGELAILKIDWSD